LGSYFCLVSLVIEKDCLLKALLILFISVFVLSGCAKVQHLDQLLTLKGLADEQVKLGKYVDKQDQKFEMMLEEVKAGTLVQYLNKRKIVRTFGDPIYVKQVKRDDQELETWMYRYSTQFFDSEKVYLYFDSDDNLVESQYIGANDGEVR